MDIGIDDYNDLTPNLAVQDSTNPEGDAKPKKEDAEEAKQDDPKPNVGAIKLEK